MKPAMLPKNLECLASLADQRSTRYTLGGVHVHTFGDETYYAEASNGRYAIRVSGSWTDYVDDQPEIPALASAPNGEVEAIVHAKDWKAAFRTKASHVATVIGKEVVTLASAAKGVENVTHPDNMAGRFPNVSGVIPDGAPVASIRVQANDLLAVARALTELAANDADCVTIELREKAPAVLRLENQEQKTVVVICGQ